MTRFAERLFAWLERLLGLIFIGAVLLNFANVVGRYFFDRSIDGADEVQLFILVAITFLGAAVVSYRDAHLRMDVILNGFPEPLRRAVLLGQNLVVLVLAGSLVVISWRYTQRIFALGQTSDMAEIPMWIAHGTLLAGLVLIAAVALARAAAAVAGAVSGRRPGAGGERVEP